MQIEPYIVIYSPWLCDLVGKLQGNKPMAFAVPPNILIFRDDKHPLTSQWLTHEKVHILQFWESLGLSHLISTVEYYYARIWLKLKPDEAYFYQAIEQEAWANQHNPDYLKQRNFWSFWKYLSHKPVKGRTADYLPIISAD